MAVQALGSVLRVVGPAQLDAALKVQDDKAAAAQDAATTTQTDYSSLGGFIRREFEQMQRHRNNNVAGWSDRLLNALRVFNGQYDSDKINEIRKFGGSEVYARVVAMKCRGASSLLRDVYLSPDRPWGLDPADDPKIPDEIMKAINDLVTTEISGAGMSGQQPDIDQIRDRTKQLVEAARQAAKKKVSQQAIIAEDKLTKS